jgi:hypothetical protein
VNVGDEVLVSEVSIQPTIHEHVSQAATPHQSQPVSLKSSPRPHEVEMKSSAMKMEETPSPRPAIDPLDLVSEMISQAKESPRYHSSRNVSPRTSNAVIYPPPSQQDTGSDEPGLISNLPSHDHLDDAMTTNFPSDPTPRDPLLSPSGTSVSSLTFATHHLQQHPSPPDSSRQRRLSVDSPRHVIQNELNDLHKNFEQATEEAEDEEDDFAQAMKGVTLLQLNRPALVHVGSAESDQEKKRTKSQVTLKSPLADIKYHPKVDFPDVVLVTASPPVDLAASTSHSSREGNISPVLSVLEKPPSPVIMEQPGPVVMEQDRPAMIMEKTRLPIVKETPSPVLLETPIETMKRRKGLFEPVELRPESFEAGKKGVGHSKLDPKMTVNNRLRALEDTITSMADIINAHHRALDAIPMRLKRAVPTDLIARLAGILHKLDPNTASSESTQSNTTNNLILTSESLSDEVMMTIIERVMASLPNHQPPSPSQKLSSQNCQTPTLALVTEEDMKIFANRMISTGCFDEFQKCRSGRSTGGRGGGGDDDLITRGELSQLFDHVLTGNPLQIMIPTATEGSDEASRGLHSPITLPSSSSSHTQDNSLLRSFPHSTVATSANDLKSLADKFQHTISQQIQQNGGHYMTRDDLESSLLSTHSHFEKELHKLSRHHPLAPPALQPSPSILLTTTSSHNDRVTLERTAELEKSLGEVQHLVNNLEITLKKHISSTFLKEKLTLQESNDQAWKPEIEKINESISKSMTDHKELAKAVSESLHLPHTASYAIRSPLSLSILPPLSCWWICNNYKKIY